MSDVDLTELFTSPPPEFVAARNALAKSLRAEKRRDEAAAVTAIRRPSWVDWALNAAASAQPDAARAYVDAAAELREAQAASIEGREGPDLRTSLRELRDATAAFAKHASAALVGADRAPDAADIAARLGEVAADPATVGQLLAGVLGSSETDGPDLFGGLTPPSKPGKAAKATKATKAKTAARKGGAVDEPDDGEAAAAAAKAAEQRAALESALADAERDQAAATADVEDAEEQVREAEEAEARARAALEEAQQAGKEARARHRDAAKALASLDKAVDAARAALDG